MSRAANKAVAATSAVPTYGLYGEAAANAHDFWIHAEPIASRSSIFNWEIARHRHQNFFQLLYIRTGEGDAILGEVKHRLGAGSLVLVPPKIPHGFRFSQDIDGHVITTLADRLMQGRPALRSTGLDAAALRLDQASPEAAYLAGTLERLIAEIAGGLQQNSGMIDAYLTIVLGLASRLVDASDAKGAATPDQARIARLNDLISTHFREQKPVEFYAERLGISPTHLNRIARSQTGRPVSGLIADRIIAEARRGLLFSILPVQAIAEDLGFADPAYFSRFFRNAMGETPRAWRDRQRRLADAGS